MGRGYKGKGSTIMAICDGAGRPLGFSIHSADCHETKCLEDVLEAVLPENLPTTLFDDKAYDSQSLQFEVAQNWNIEFDAPLRANSTRIVNEKENEIKNRKERWKIERLFSWIKSFRRTNMRWEYHPENFISWIFLAATAILFHRF